MSFKTEMQQLARELIVEDTDFGSVSQQVIHQQQSYMSYDEEYGDMIHSTDEYLLTAMIGPFTNTKSNAHDIAAGDLRMLVPFVDVSSDFRVSLDRIITLDGTVYTIESVSKDAAESVYTLQLRKDNG